jgi:hypothetical protein
MEDPLHTKILVDGFLMWLKSIRFDSQRIGEIDGETGMGGGWVPKGLPATKLEMGYFQP